MTSSQSPELLSASRRDAMFTKAVRQLVLGSGSAVVIRERLIRLSGDGSFFEDYGCHPFEVPALLPPGDSRLPGPHHPTLSRGGYMRSPSWSRCARGEASREGKRQSESDSKGEQRKQP
ncbi:dysbindin domain-containing protein 1-like [Arapaima gigas]